MKRILITGATGFIGNALLRHLLQVCSEQDSLHAVHLSPVEEKLPGVQWHKADLLDVKERKDLFVTVEPTHLVHLAWCAEHGTYWRDPANFDWMNATLDMAKLFKANKGERCLFAGTSAEYDWSGQTLLSEEETLLKPQFLYGGCKLGTYWALHEYFNQEKISWAWPRFFNPFGPGEDSRRLIPKTFSRIMNGEILTFDAALSLRDFLYIDDVAEALTAILLSPVQGAVNVGSGNAVSVREIISKIAALCGKPENVKFESSNDISVIPDSVVANVKKLNENCKWKPSKNLDERLEDTYNWLCQAT